MCGEAATKACGEGMGVGASHSVGEAEPRVRREQVQLPQGIGMAQCDPQCVGVFLYACVFITLSARRALQEFHHQTMERFARCVSTHEACRFDFLPRCASGYSLLYGNSILFQVWYNMLMSSSEGCI